MRHVPKPPLALRVFFAAAAVRHTSYFLISLPLFLLQTLCLPPILSTDKPRKETAKLCGFSVRLLSQELMPIPTMSNDVYIHELYMLVVLVVSQEAERDLVRSSQNGNTIFCVCVSGLRRQ